MAFSMPLPIISVVMPVFNAEGFVARAIESILNQTLKDFEFIIIDDSSTDNSVRVMKSFHDPRIKLICNEKNVGVGASLNIGIKKARGKYIARMDADDVSYRNRLVEQIKFLERNRDVSVLGSCASLFDENGEIWGSIVPLAKPKLKDWLWSAQVIHASVLMKKEDVKSVGGYDSEANRFEDYDLWLRIIKNGYVINTLQKELYGIHWDSSHFGRKAAKDRILESKCKLMRFRDLRVPIYKYFMILKPILPIFVPKSVYFSMHAYSLKKRSSSEPVAGKIDDILHE